MQENILKLIRKSAVADGRYRYDTGKEKLVGIVVNSGAYGSDRHSTAQRSASQPAGGQYETFKAAVFVAGPFDDVGLRGL